jgi:hypothetical protein
MTLRLLKLCVLTLAGSVAACTGVIDGPGGSAASGSRGETPGSNGSGAGGNGGTLTAKPIDLTGSPQYFRFVRLTNQQWAQSVQDLLRLTAPSSLDSNFQTAVAGTTDFSNNELVLDVTQRSWSDYQTAAETLAAQVTATDAALQKIYAGTDAAGFIAAFGRRAHRRPLTSAEMTKYMAIHTTGSAMTGTQSAFTKGAALVIRTMLQSPFFLYRTELSANGVALSAYEIAAKLSLWLRGTTPSDALLDSAAGPGMLDTANGATTLAQTMLGESTAASIMRNFHGELLQFDRYPTVVKTGVANYVASLNDEYLQASILFFDKIFTQGLGVREILTSTSGFVGPGLAKLYGIAAPSSGFVERDLGGKRVGYFSQIPYLSLYSFNLQPDSIHRGVLLNLDILCADPGVPVAVIPPIPPLMPNQTNREMITTLTGGCGAECHGTFINPIGFAFENFDGMGQWRDIDNGKPVDSAGTYPFAEGVKSFSGAADLMRSMASGGQAHACYAKKLASFALQRDIVASDMPLLDTLKASSMASNGSTKQIMLDLVKNAAFRTRVGGAP